MQDFQSCSKYYYFASACVRSRDPSTCAMEISNKKIL